MYNAYLSTLHISNCTYTSNVAVDGGGFYGSAASNYPTFPTITNCAFTSNEATQYGGGIYNTLYSSPTISNCTINSNISGIDGSAICNANYCSPNILNSIIYGNSGSLNVIRNSNGSSPAITYSCIQGGYSGTGNISADSLFVNAPTNLRLLDYSPCTNSGSGDAHVLGLSSLEGFGTNTNEAYGDTGIVDMGYHYSGYLSGVSCPATPESFLGTAESTSQIQWSWDSSSVIDEIGYSLHDANHNLICLATVDATGTLESGLTANTQYSRHVHSYNDGGESLPSTTDAKYTLAVPPNVTSNKIGTTCTFTSMPAFGPGGVQYYQYTWTQSATETWGGGSTTWSSGLLTLEAPTDGWYLHLKSFNGDNIANPTTLDSGPYGPFNKYWYVDAGVAGPGSGTQLDPFKTINSAEAKAVTGEAIYVRMGVYRLTSTITLDSGTYLRGGFDGNWNSTGDATTTVISGDATVGCMYGSYLSSATTVEYFTVRSGSADAGAGLYLNNSSPRIISCIFTSNEAKSTSYGGGGMYNATSSPKILNCAFTFNSAVNGSGIFNYTSSYPLISSCAFTSNNASNNGGGIYNILDTPAISNCAFTSNKANGSGGGIYNSNSSPSISNCSFISNSATSGSGGGIFNIAASPTITNCIFTLNSGSVYGGGIQNFSSSAPIISNCTFTSNSSANGGGIYAYSSASPKIKNSIVYYQTSGGNISNDAVSTPEVTYSCIQGGYPGTGNISADALFVNAAGGDVHLLDYSPCTNSGSGDANTIGLGSTEGCGTNTDMTKGDTGIVDMGYHYTGYTGGVAYPDAPSGFLGTAESVSTIHWSWASNVVGEIGYSLHNSYSSLEALIGAGIYTTVESGLTANTQYTRHVHSYNDGGESLPSTTDAKYTWAVPPNVTSNKIGTTCTFTSMPAFGPGGVQYYQYTWTQSATETWGGGGTTWSSGLLTLEAPTDGWYLHLKSFNGDNIANPTTLDSGPYGHFNNYWYVDAGVAGPGSGSPTDPFKTINSAETVAVTSDAIFVRMGVYHLTQTITLDSGTYLKGGFDGNWSPTGDATTTIISGEGKVQCMYGSNLSSPTTIENFTIKKGYMTGNGGGLYLTSSSPTITNCAFTSNNATIEGGGIYCLTSSPEVIYCTFNLNLASGGGGMADFTGSSPTIMYCAFTTNVATVAAGMDNSGSSPTIMNCTFTSNRATTSNAGGMRNWASSSPFISYCTFESNSAGGSGGGIVNNSSAPTITNCTFTSNKSTTVSNKSTGGGGIYNITTASPIIKNCNFTSNCATSEGGAIYNSNATATVSNCSFASNSGDFGGAIYNYNTTGTNTPSIITNCTFTSNRTYSQDGGGCMYNWAASPEVSNCTFTLNIGGYGGAIVNNYASATIESCTFTSNSATSVFGGGALYNYNPCSPTIKNCTFISNSATSEGGGIYNNNCPATIINCTLTLNSAEAHSGGGIYDENCSPTIKNSIIYYQTSGVSISNDATSTPTVTYSDIQNGYTGTGNISSEPLFASGPKGNVYLLTTSECIDKGTGEASDLGLDYVHGYGTNPNGVNGDSGTVDMGYHYTGYTASAINPLIITTASQLPDGMEGSAYNMTLVATGGVAPYTWSLKSGSLPLGLTLETSGLLHGTPSTFEIQTFTVEVGDSQPVVNDKQFSLTITPPGLKMPLAAGFNLFSLPVIPEDTSISSVIGDQLAGLTAYIYSYSPSSGWRIAYYDGTWKGSLTSIEADKGYWIKVNSAVTVEVTGNLSGTDRTIALKGQKANLVGTAYNTTRTMAQTNLSSYLTSSDKVWGYINNTWKPAIYSGGSWSGALTTFEPGRGYWVIKNSAGDVDWVYPKP